MARLKEYNGYYCESEYEYAFIRFLETEGWIYSSGNNISRVTKRDVLIADDFKKFIVDTNPDLTEDEVTQIFDNVRLVGSESDFATLHKVYGWMVNGIQFTPQDGIARMIPLIDFKKDSNKNIFRVVNQFTVEYTNNGQKENRRPDVLLFVNGMPLCVIELKILRMQMRPFMMRGSKLISAIGEIFHIFCITVLWLVSPTVLKQDSEQSVLLMSIFMHGGV